MPNYKKHLLGGLVTYAGVLYAMSKHNPSPLIAAQWLVCCLIGSLFPDIDTKSKIQKILYIALLVIFITLCIQNKIKLLMIVSILGTLPLIVNHRGLFHNIWFIMLMNLTILVVTTIFSPNNFHFVLHNIIFFIAGTISHLWLDLGLKRMLRI